MTSEADSLLNIFITNPSYSSINDLRCLKQLNKNDMIKK